MIRSESDVGTESGAQPLRGRPSRGAREALLHSALEILRERGIAQLSTREVARRAGLSEASVFYHFHDKVGLLEEVLLAGLEPVKRLPPDLLGASPDQPLGVALLGIGAALEEFFDGAMPILAAVQGDADLRAEFAARLAERDLGPHRGVRLVAQYLSSVLPGLVRQGASLPGTGSDLSGDAVAMLLVGACFLRSWERHLHGAGHASALPTLAATVEAIATLLDPPAVS